MTFGTIGKFKDRLIRSGLRFCEKTFLHKKLNNWFGYLILSFVAITFGYLLAKDTMAGLSLFGLILGLGVVIVCMSSAETGLYITVIYSFFAFFLSRLLFKGTLSVGVIFDVLVLATFLGLLRGLDFKQSFNEFYKTPIVVCLLSILFYTIIEFFNPNSHSLNTWYLAVRKFTGYVLLLFIAYNVFDSYESVRKFLRMLFIVSTITAIYGCIQQWHGYFNFEMQLILSDEHGFGLIFLSLIHI